MRQSSPVARGKLIIHNNTAFKITTGVDVFGFNDGLVNTNDHLTYAGVQIDSYSIYTLDNFVDANVENQLSWFRLNNQGYYEPQESNVRFGELFDLNDLDSDYFVHWNALKGQITVVSPGNEHILVPIDFLVWTPEHADSEEVRQELAINCEHYGIAHVNENDPYFHLRVVSYLQVVNATETDTHIKISNGFTSNDILENGFTSMFQ
jgi:hypothetical protein